MPGARRFLALALLSATLLVACGGRQGAGTPPIILISIDTLRADMLGAYGYERYPTSPVIDSFAAESVVFDCAIVTEPRTLTSHMSMLTGLDPQHHRVEDDSSLPEAVPTLAALLAEAGYSTHAIVDDGYMDSRWGFDRGFASYEAGTRRGFDAIVPEAVELLEGLQAAGNEKFFLFLHTYDVHNRGLVPFYDSPEQFRGMFARSTSSPLAAADTLQAFERVWPEVEGSVSEEDREYLKARYAEGIRHVDGRLRELFDFLRREGIYDRALIVVLADHGEGLLDHGGWGHGELVNDTIRVPLMIKLPGGRLAGTRIESPVSLVDIAPTILQLGGYPEPVTMDGVSLVPLLEGDRGRDFVFSRRTKGGLRLFSIRSERYHLIWDGSTDETSFYDLAADPHEHADLSPSGTPMESAMRERLAQWVEAHDRALEAKRRNDVVIDPDLLRSLRALGYLR